LQFTSGEYTKKTARFQAKTSR